MAPSSTLPSQGQFFGPSRWEPANLARCQATRDAHVLYLAPRPISISIHPHWIAGWAEEAWEVACTGRLVKPVVGLGALQGHSGALFAVALPSQRPSAIRGLSRTKPYRLKQPLDFSRVEAIQGGLRGTAAGTPPGAAVASGDSCSLQLKPRHPWHWLFFSLPLIACVKKETRVKTLIAVQRRE